MSATVINANNMDPDVGLPSLADASVDAVVTDPPAGICFMGRVWDSDKGGRDKWIAWLASVMRECLRVLKPGGHALVWALPRTSHWTATAIEDAGFEIRDVGVHLFGTGFPKSKNIGDGRGTALKPAAEHWILARKPLDGTVAANVLKYGTGALNIDGCRIASEARPKMVRTSTVVAATSMSGVSTGATSSGEDTTLGRWPAHVTLDEGAAAMLDAQSGVTKSSSHIRRNSPKPVTASKGREYARTGTGPSDEGGASRFFYVAKASRREKTANSNVENRHPTVKSVALMRWLCRLITPPGGLVLDPFAGSGSTALACIAEGFRFVGFERETEYATIATARIEAAK